MKRKKSGGGPVGGSGWWSRKIKVCENAQKSWGGGGGSGRGVRLVVMKN